MSRILVPLCGLVLAAGCSSVPTQPQAVAQVQSNCDTAQMEKIERARQPVLVERYWVNCPQAPQSANSGKAPS